MRIFSLLIFLLFFTGPLAAAEIPEKAAAVDVSENGVTVLIYHRFGENTYPTTNISLDRFREQLEYLKNNDYTVISLEMLLGYLTKNTSLPPRCVVLTMDDGYRSVYEKAWPLLQEYTGII